VDPVSDPLLLRKSGYGRRATSTLTTRHPSILKKLALTLLASGGRLVGMVRSRTQATGLFILGTTFYVLPRVKVATKEFFIYNLNQQSEFTFYKLML
jgi:hypothetical protein